MSIHLNPCPKCRGKHIGVSAQTMLGRASFHCHTCGYIAYYQHCAKDVPFANAAKDYWDNLVLAPPEEETEEPA